MLEESSVKKKCDLLATRLITEDNKGESFHIHFRNMRLELSEEEFSTLCEHLIRSYQAHRDGRGILKDDGRDDYRARYYVLDEVKIPQAPDIHPTKFQIEVNHPRRVHLHLRNFRLEFSFGEFRKFARAVNSSLLEFKGHRKRKGLLGLFRRPKT
jgi:hypothetical protein